MLFNRFLGIVFLLVPAFVWSLGGCDRAGQESSQNKSIPAEIKLSTPGPAPVFFKERTAESPLSFVHSIGKTSSYHFPAIMVGGCGVLDFDGDGLLDIVTVDSGDFEDVLKGKIDSRVGNGNRIYRQLPPQDPGKIGEFLDVTDTSGLIDRGYGSSVAVGDVNNDGRPDLFFGNYGEDSLFLNLGGGKFRDATQECGIKNPLWSASASFFDYDRDGRLDLFITNYVSYLPQTNCATAGEAEDYCSPRVFSPVSDKLFRNVTSPKGDVRFIDVSAEVGIGSREGPGLGVVTGDFSGDGWPDVYVANDGAANFLWVNSEGKSFQEQASQLGCATGLQGEAQAGMGVVAADVDNNQQADLIVTHLDGETNAAYLGHSTLVKGNERTFYSESGIASGVQKISKPMTGFGLGTADLDNDGDLDLVTANGRVNRRQPLPAAVFWDDYREPNQIALNDGSGKFMELKSKEDGFLNGALVSRGLAMADFNNDGRLDCLVANIAGRVQIQENVYATKNHWIGFQVTDPSLGGRPVFGAILRLQIDGQTLMRTVRSDGSYLSANDCRVHFGLGDADDLEGVTVRWPDQSTEFYAVHQLDGYRLIEKGAGVRVPTSTKTMTPRKVK
ncbi:MAG: CRTAC1 family protein [Pirellulaceae bacterium]|nr:CRTAC1 family protein [Pirellulaceae bacterium]